MCVPTRRDAGRVAAGRRAGARVPPCAAAARSARLDKFRRLKSSSSLTGYGYGLRARAPRAPARGSEARLWCLVSGLSLVPAHQAGTVAVQGDPRRRATARGRARALTRTDRRRASSGPCRSRCRRLAACALSRARPDCPRATQVTARRRTAMRGPGATAQRVPTAEHQSIIKLCRVRAPCPPGGRMLPQWVRRSVARASSHHAGEAVRWRGLALLARRCAPPGATPPSRCRPPQEERRTARRRAVASGLQRPRAHGAYHATTSTKPIAA